MRRRFFGWIAAGLGLGAAAILAAILVQSYDPFAAAAVEPAALPTPFSKLVSLHKPLGTPRPGDWLDRHVEAGQDYRQYVASAPRAPDHQRRTIYVQPLGKFDSKQRAIVDITARFLAVEFQLPVKVNQDLPLSLIPKDARRRRPDSDAEQLLTTYVMQRVLKPRLPADAVAMIALTASDLWPGKGWNFVFGQAMLSERVGVWSLHRFGDPTASDEEYRLTLRRTLKTAAHETGHMFSLPHCIFYECCMDGSNHLEEADRQPLWLCPQCLAKVCYATGADPAKRFRELIAFAHEQNFGEEETFWRESLAAIEQP